MLLHKSWGNFTDNERQAKRQNTEYIRRYLNKSEPTEIVESHLHYIYQILEGKGVQHYSVQGQPQCPGAIICSQSHHFHIYSSQFQAPTVKAIELHTGQTQRSQTTTHSELGPTPPPPHTNYCNSIAIPYYCNSVVIFCSNGLFILYFKISF